MPVDRWENLADLSPVVSAVRVADITWRFFLAIGSLLFSPLTRHIDILILLLLFLVFVLLLQSLFRKLFVVSTQLCGCSAASDMCLVGGIELAEHKRTSFKSQPAFRIRNSLRRRLTGLDICFRWEDSFNTANTCQQLDSFRSFHT